MKTKIYLLNVTISNHQLNFYHINDFKIETNSLCYWKTVFQFNLSNIYFKNNFAVDPCIATHPLLSQVLPTFFQPGAVCVPHTVHVHCTL